MEKEILLPKLGESILSATVVSWLKKEGERVALDEPLLEVSTDKVTSEIPSPFAGILKKIVAQTDQEIKVGEVLGVIETEMENAAPLKEQGNFSDSTERDKKEKPFNAAGKAKKSSFLSPAVKKLLREHRISSEEMHKIPCSGKRLSRSDVEAYLEKREKPAQTGDTGQASSEETVPLSPLRKKIAENLSRTCCIPTASVFVEADITGLYQFIQQEKESFLAREKAKLTITSFVAFAIGRAALKLPLINSTLSDGKIKIHRRVNLGLAIDRKEGLVVPVIKDAHRKEYQELARDIAVFKDKALKDRLALEEMQNGTVTLTNFGMGGVLFGIPLLRCPESAIIGMGAIQKKNVLSDDGKILKQYRLPISMTFDHRHIDGMYACSFMQEIKNILGQQSW